MCAILQQTESALDEHNCDCQTVHLSGMHSRLSMLKAGHSIVLCMLSMPRGCDRSTGLAYVQFSSQLICYVISMSAVGIKACWSRNVGRAALSLALLQGITTQDFTAEAVADELMAEEEQSKAKVAATIAKRHKQKAKKGQQRQLACQLTPNVSTAEAEPFVCMDSHGASGPCETAVRDVHTTPRLQPHLDVQEVTACSEADADNASFLDQLFCCPLTQVRSVLGLVFAFKSSRQASCAVAAMPFHFMRVNGEVCMLLPGLGSTCGSPCGRGARHQTTQSVNLICGC